MSSEQPEPAVAVAADASKSEKSPSFHVLPNSETLHVVKDPLVLHRSKSADEANSSEANEEKSPSFHLLPNSETLHVVKDPLKIK